MVESSALIIGEEEQFVLDHRTTNRPSEHIPTQLWRSNWSGGIKAVLPFIGIQGVVAKELPDISMQGVGTGLERSVDDAAIEVAIFGWRVLRNQIEFLDGVGRRSQPETVF